MSANAIASEQQFVGLALRHASGDAERQARQEFADYHGKLYGIARKIGETKAAFIGVPTYEDLAADIVAESLVSYCRWRLTNEPIDGDFSAAIRQSMRLVAGRCLKRRARQWNREPVLLAGRPDSKGDAPDATLVAAPPVVDDSWRVLAAIRRLPAKLQPVAAYFAVASPDRPADKRDATASPVPSLKQAAEALGMSPPTVAKRLQALGRERSMAWLLGARIVDRMEREGTRRKTVVAA